jgi:hypothetical protein
MESPQEQGAAGMCQTIMPGLLDEDEPGSEQGQQALEEAMVSRRQKEHGHGRGRTRGVAYYPRRAQTGDTDEDGEHQEAFQGLQSHLEDHGLGMHAEQTAGTPAGVGKMGMC